MIANDINLDLKAKFYNQNISKQIIHNLCFKRFTFKIYTLDSILLKSLHLRVQMISPFIHSGNNLSDEYIYIMFEIKITRIRKP